jgi:hypothetical protein
MSSITFIGDGFSSSALLIAPSLITTSEYIYYVTFLYALLRRVRQKLSNYQQGGRNIPESCEPPRFSPRCCYVLGRLGSQLAEISKPISDVPVLGLAIPDVALPGSPGKNSGGALIGPLVAPKSRVRLYPRQLTTARTATIFWSCSALLLRR